MKLIKSSLAAVVACAALFSSSAFSADITVGIEVFDADISYSNVDIKEDDRLLGVFASIEHDYSLAPNARLEYREQIPGLARYDLTGYYKLVDSDSVKFDLGGGLTYFDFDGLFDAEYPLHVYSAIDVSLPAPGLSVFANARAFVNDDVDGHDASVGVRWAMASTKHRPGYGFNLGYRHHDHTFEDLNGVEVGIKNKGPFLSVDATF